MAIAVAIGGALGQWQIRRALEKEALEMKLAAYEATSPIVLKATAMVPEALEYRRVVVTGEFVHDWPVYLDNRPYRGAAGFYVVMPLKIANSSQYLLIARGWVARDFADRGRLPVMATPRGLVQVQGIVKRNLGQVLQLGPAETLHPNAVVQNLDISAWAVASKLPLQAFVIEQSNDTGDGLVRDWPRPAAGSERNRGYALQWYGLAATAFLFFVVTGFRREKD